MRSILLFVTLMGFWLLLSGQFESSFLIGSGVVSSALAVFCCHRLGLIGASYQPIASLPGFLLYLPWLLSQIVIASLDVTRRSWSPRPAIQPRLVKVPHKIDHPLAQTLLANSITLTPGTVTVDVAEDHLLVHALTEAAQKGVLEGSMAQRVSKLIPDSDDHSDTGEDCS
ncbi:MAG: cation:proton antiporter [Planctomycetes bacterium]|nr:cation:proton antiporter [Planctomycetota bacterium]